jgi:pimeloyl-ACP methyl ester carboxylesterase/V8-like Glu-specific endopeptidase
MSSIIVRGSVVSYEVIGRGRPVVLVGGLFDSLECWLPSMGKLSSHFRVYWPKLWGENEENKTDLFKFNIETYVTLLEGFTESLGILSTCMIGHDVGGIAALLYAARHNWQNNQQFQVLAICTPMSFRDIDPRLLAALYSPRLTKDYLHQAESDAVTQKLHGFNIQAIQHSMQSLTMLNTGDILGKIQSPVALLHGQEDRIVSPPDADQLVFRKNIHFIPLPHSRHFPMLDDAGPFEQLLLDKLLTPIYVSPAPQQTKTAIKQSPIQLASATARIYNKYGQVMAAGFLVGKKTVVTCAHALESHQGTAAEFDENPIQLDFPQSDKYRGRFEARILVVNPESDIAILELQGSGSQDPPLRLLGNQDLRGHSFRSFGFPAQYQSGVWSGGMILDRTPQGWIQIEGEEIGHRIQAGFSGSPVWDEDLGGVVGMVVDVDNQSNSRTAFINPTSSITKNWQGISLDQAESTGLPKKAARVFLCHATVDKQAVRELYQRLSGDGFLPWLDEESLLPGQVWQDEIPKAIHGSNAIVVCLSKRSILKSGYVQKEIRHALDVADEKPEGRIFIIPLRLEECEVPDRLRKFHWVDYFYEQGYEKLVRSLQLCAEYEE